MMKKLTALLAAAACAAATAQIPDGPLNLAALAEATRFVALMAQAADNVQSHARLTDGQVLLTDPSPSKAKLAQCQPLKGELVAIMETRSAVDGMLGLDVAHVVVLEGTCKGDIGWVGLSRLEKAPAKAAQ